MGLYRIHVFLCVIFFQSVFSRHFLYKSKAVDIMYLVLTETEMYMCLCNLHFVSIGHYILLNFD